MLEMLRDLPLLPGCKYVFWNSKTKTRWVNVRKVWNKARKLAGYEWMEIHDLRRFKSSELREQGIPIEDISQLMGHSSIRTTQKHYIEEHRREVAKRVLEKLEPKRQVN